MLITAYFNALLVNTGGMKVCPWTYVSTDVVDQAETD